MSKDRVILHCDLNNFFASVEMQLRPELRGRAIAVCGDPQKRHGIVLAKSELAKAAGVKTAEPIWQAKRKCPALIVVAPHYAKYSAYSKEVYQIYTEFTPEVESFGLDECWLDVTGSKRLFGTGEEIAERIRQTVKERTGLTVSVGVSFNKIFAKLGSDLKKPDAVSVINRENYQTVAWQLPVQDMLFVGRSTAEALSKIGIRTIGDLARADDRLLERFGKHGKQILQNARGENAERVKNYYETRAPESIGNGSTTAQDVTNKEEAASLIYSLCEMIGFRLRQHNMLARGVSVHLRDRALQTRSKQGKLASATCSGQEIAERALALLTEIHNFDTMLPLRTITIGTYHLLREADYLQPSFFDEETDKKMNLEKSVDVLRKKFGYSVLQRGITMETLFVADNREAEDDFIPFGKTEGEMEDS